MRNLLKTILIFALLIWAFFACCSCNTTRKHFSSIKQADTFILTVTNTVHDTFVREKVTVKRDTVIGIPGQKVQDTIAADYLAPATNSKGKPVPTYREKFTNGLRAWVMILPDGDLVYGAESDSLNIVVRNLTHIIDSIGSKHTASSDRNSTHRSSTEKTSEKVVTKIRVPAWVYLTVAILILLEVYLRWKRK